MTGDVRTMEALYFWGVARRARQMKADGNFCGPEADAILDDLSAIAVCTRWPTMQRRAEEAGQMFTEWLEAA